jgi:hypothetical protein
MIWSGLSLETQRPVVRSSQRLALKKSFSINCKTDVSHNGTSEDFQALCGKLLSDRNAPSRKIVTQYDPHKVS